MKLITFMVLPYSPCCVVVLLRRLVFIVVNFDCCVLRNVFSWRAPILVITAVRMVRLMIAQ